MEDRTIHRVLPSNPEHTLCGIPSEIVLPWVTDEEDLPTCEECRRRGRASRESILFRDRESPGTEGVQAQQEEGLEEEEVPSP